MKVTEESYLPKSTNPPASILSKPGEGLQVDEEVTDDDLFTQSFNFVKKSLTDLLNDDAVKSYHNHYRVKLSSVLKIIFLTLLSVFLWTNYDSQREAVYLSLDNTSGECKQVPYTIRGVFEMDDNGYWTGNSQFIPSRALYRYRMNKFQHTESEYTAYIADLKYMLNSAVAAGAKDRNLVDNLVYWVVWQYKRVDTIGGSSQAHLFELTGDTKSLFSRQYMLSTISNQYYMCQSKSITSYDKLSGVLTISYIISDYNAKPISSVSALSKACSEIVDSKSLGYNSAYNLNQFDIKIDLMSLMNAHALNENIIKIMHMTSVYTSSATTYTSLSGKQYDLKEFTDAKYPGMLPIYCLIQKTDENNFFCLVKVAGLFGYPFFLHKGVSGKGTTPTYQPTPCNCSDSTGSSLYCQQFQFLVGLIIFNPAGGGKPDEATQIMSMLNMYEYSIEKGENINKKAFKIAYTSVVSGPGTSPPAPSMVQDSIDFQILLSPSVRKENTQFCQGNCSMISINIQDDYSTTINPALLSISAGSCADTFSINDSAWENLNDPQQSPSILIQDYYECIPFVQDAVQSAVGLAMGNLSAVMPIIVAIVLALVAAFGIRPVAPQKGIYDEDTQRKAVDELGRYLLLLRDNKVKKTKEEEELFRRMLEVINGANETDLEETPNFDGYKNINQSNYDADINRSSDTSLQFITSQTNNDIAKQTVLVRTKETNCTC